jgi:glycosyltransferase involved in cell wall biosynthesis
MKIVIIGPIYPYRGGISHYTAMLAQAFAKAEHQIEVISFSRQYPAWLYPGSSDKDPSQMHLITQGRFILDPFLPWTWLRAAKEVSAFKPDVVIIQWWTTFWAIPYSILGYWLKRMGLRSVFMIHNVLPHEPRPWDPWLAKQALSKGYAFIAQTEHEKVRLLDLIPNSAVQVCQIPTFTMFHINHLSKPEARRRLQLPDKQYVLLFFGFVRPYKGLKHLLQALSLLQIQGGKPYLIVAGEFWEDHQSYQNQIDLLKLTDQVYLENRYIPNEEVEVFFSAADCLVAPYVGGTQSAAVSIARSFGLPMIVTDIVAQGIDKENYRNIIVVPAGDPQVLACAIQRAMESLTRIPCPSSNENQDDWDCLVQAILQMIPS